MGQRHFMFSVSFNTSLDLSIKRQDLQYVCFKLFLYSMLPFSNEIVYEIFSLPFQPEAKLNYANVTALILNSLNSHHNVDIIVAIHFVPMKELRK